MMTETVVQIDNNRNPSSGQQPKSTPATSATPAQGLSWIKCNIEYFKTLPGIIKLVELIIGIICMSLASPAYLGATHFFLFVAVTSFIATILWSFAYLLGVREVLNLPVNWILTELINTGLATLLYFVAFILQLSVWAGQDGRIHYAKGSNIAAGVFGLLNTLVYAGGAYFLYVEHKSGATQ